MLKTSFKDSQNIGSGLSWIFVNKLITPARIQYMTEMNLVTKIRNWHDIVRGGNLHLNKNVKKLALNTKYNQKKKKKNSIIHVLFYIYCSTAVPFSNRLTIFITLSGEGRVEKYLASRREGAVVLKWSRIITAV